MTRTWTEVNVNSEGISVTVYEAEDENAPATVVDEFMMTHDEMQDRSNHNHYTLE